MRRGLPQDYANALCGVVTGWQAEADMEQLHDWGSGTLVMDLLGETTHVDGKPASVSGAERIPRIWLLDRAEWDGLATSDVQRAVVTVDFDCAQWSRDGLPLWRFRDYRCRSELSLAGRAAHGRLRKTAVGLYQRWGGGWTYYEGDGAAAAAKDVPELRERYAAARDAGA